MILGGCSTDPARLVVSPTVETSYPPDALLRDCRRPYRQAATTGDVVDQLVITRGALDECSVKVACVREWRKRTDPAYTVPSETLRCADPERPETTVAVVTKSKIVAGPIAAKPVSKSKAKQSTQPATKRVNPKRRAPMTPIDIEKLEKHAASG